MTTIVNEIREFSRLVGNTQFICGWVEGPLAEYCDLRDVSAACLDMFENPEKLKLALDIMTESAMQFITAQVNAGAHCIGIGDAVCSLISPDLYQEFVFPLEKAISRSCTFPECESQASYLRKHHRNPAGHDQYRCRYY